MKTYYDIMNKLVVVSPTNSATLHIDPIYIEPTLMLKIMLGEELTNGNKEALVRCYANQRKRKREVELSWTNK